MALAHAAQAAGHASKAAAGVQRSWEHTTGGERRTGTELELSSVRGTWGLGKKSEGGRSTLHGGVAPGLGRGASTARTAGAAQRAQHATKACCPTCCALRCAGGWQRGPVAALADYCRTCSVQGAAERWLGARYHKASNRLQAPSDAAAGARKGDGERCGLVACTQETARGQQPDGQCRLCTLSIRRPGKPRSARSPPHQASKPNSLSFSASSSIASRKYSLCTQNRTRPRAIHMPEFHHGLPLTVVLHVLLHGQPQVLANRTDHTKRAIQATFIILFTHSLTVIFGVLLHGQPHAPTCQLHTQMQSTIPINSLSFSASSSIASRRYSVRAKRSHSVSPSSRSCLWMDNSCQRNQTTLT